MSGNTINKQMRRYASLYTTANLVIVAILYNMNVNPSVFNTIIGAMVFAAVTKYLWNIGHE